MQKDEAFVQGARQGKARTVRAKASSGPRLECGQVARRWCLLLDFL